MNEIIQMLKNEFPSVNSEICKELGVYISLGKIKERDYIVLKIDNCISMSREFSEKKCDCIIIFIEENKFYISIVELKKTARIERNFQEKFLNCYEKFVAYLKSKEIVLRFRTHFVIVKEKVDGMFTKFLGSINNRFTIDGKPKEIMILQSGACLWDEYQKILIL
ncbi:hypothetical protein LCGC14_1292540 [marine sediment metagenome]|uniref:Uncharacterized protein n=1 Tax=marine sediment metagenome TaxID=412755 RepID=A0A0F9NUW2_9ZZZZ